jgi:hypothetical protein
VTAQNAERIETLRPPPLSEAAVAAFDGLDDITRGALVDDSLPRVIRRVAIPAVIGNLLMTLFTSMDAYWVGTRLGPRGLAAVSTSIRCARPGWSGARHSAPHRREDAASRATRATCARPVEAQGPEGWCEGPYSAG